MSSQPDNQQAPAAKKQRSGLARIIRMTVFLLCPMYLFWSFKMRTGNIMAWPETERAIFLIVTLLWILAWGFAALAYLRRTRLQMQRQREMMEQQQKGGTE